MQESDNVQDTPSQTVTELTSAEEQWVWDCKPLAPDSWGNFLAFVDYRGDGTIELRRFEDVTGAAKAQSLQDLFKLGPEFAAKALEISTQLQASAVNDTPKVRYRPANLTSASRFDPRFWRDGGTRLCYVPTADDAEFVQALFPGQPNLKGGYNPNWRAVREELVVAGISPTRLVEMSPRELLLLVQKGRSPATGAGKPDLSDNAPAPTGDPKSRSTSRQPTAEKRSWTQPDLNTAIREYKTKRASNYSELVENVRAGRKGALRAAQTMFGRNAIVRALGVRSPSMVTRSPEWHAIADELGIRRGKHRNRVKGQKVGLDIALETQSTTRSESALDVAVRNETTRLIHESLPKRAAESLLEQLQQGTITDDRAREIVGLALDQRRDDKSKKVSAKP